MSHPFALFLDGSPNPAGNGMRLAGAMLEVFGGESSTARLYDMDIRPCRACGACVAECGCRERDGAAELLSRLAVSDLIVVVSPLHFTSLSAPVIAFFSRLQPYWRAKREGRILLPPRRRAGALVVTGGASYPNMFAPARAVAAAAFNSLSIPLAGMATAEGTDDMPVSKNPEALAAARALAKRMLTAIGIDG